VHVIRKLPNNFLTTSEPFWVTELPYVPLLVPTLFIPPQSPDVPIPLPQSAPHIISSYGETGPPVSIIYPYLCFGPGNFPYSPLPGARMLLPRHPLPCNVTVNCATGVLELFQIRMKRRMRDVCEPIQYYARCFVIPAIASECLIFRPVISAGTAVQALRLYC
jgi:hypothetical protein